ncbi:hypothetical protein Tco_0594712 [Tanacetum coccineum]
MKLNGINHVKANDIDLLVQQYEQFMIPEEDSIDNAFAKCGDEVIIEEGSKRKDQRYSKENSLEGAWRTMEKMKWQNI